MSRIARQDILFDGCYAHIISRSIRKMKLMRDDDDFESLYRLLILTKKMSGFQVHHYCLMHTHFHLIVSLPDVPGFSKAMQYVKSQYSYHFHKKYRLSGPVWRERFRGLLIENESYLRACGEYIENNPLKAGLVKEANNWKYSSFRHYNHDQPDDLINRIKCNKRSQKPVEIIFEEEEFFEKGKVIGSAFFRFQFHEKMKGR
ncbi:MAG: transposase [Candidatus Omnitrophota bacterium]